MRDFTIQIDKLVYGGDGIGRHEGKVVFVPGSVPGDELQVRPVEEKKTFIRASIIRVLQPGASRTEPECVHFGVCGGCHWQQTEYECQVESKRRILEELLRHRFPQIGDMPISMRPCPQPFAYRSRARIQLRGFGPRSAVGFFRCASHVVEDITHCPLFRSSLNEALAALRQFKHEVDPVSHPQEMDIACVEEEGSWVTAHTAASPSEIPPPPQRIRNKGEAILHRRVGEFLYAVTPEAFFQANDFLVAELVDLVACLAAPEAVRTDAAALDLFAGVGLFSLPLARSCTKVTAVEGSPSACRLAKYNAAAAGFPHIQTMCADVAKWLQSHRPSDFGNPDILILDPPRTGAGNSVIDAIREWNPAVVVYVSCDPQTLCRDLDRIVPDFYRIESVTGLDLFPQTYHFETVVRLTRS